MPPLFKTYYVYLLTNKNHTVIYTGVTNNIIRRVMEHKWAALRQKLNKGFTARYNVDKLVYLEEYGDIHQAIEREKQIKAGPRQKKLDLINRQNPAWRDLYQDWV